MLTNRQTNVIAVAATVLFAVPCFAVEDATKGARGAAFTFAKQAIPPSLKNPRSAEFDWDSVKVERTLPATTAANKQATIVFVSGIVRATNSFNATVPSQWRVIMLHNEDKYEPMVITNDKQFVLKTEKGEKFLKQLMEREEQKRNANGAAASKPEDAAGK